MQNYHARTKEEIFKELDTSEKGLTKKQVIDGLDKYGQNTIQRTHKLRPLRILLEQFKSFLIYILIVAAVISFFIGHNLDGGVISAIVVLNAVIGFTQQYKAEKSLQNLRKILIPHSRVMRDGKIIKIPSKELVPGDIILLEAGDKVTADCRIIEEENLETNEAILTGESMPVSKTSEVIGPKTQLTKRKNILFAGTQVVRGNTKAIIIFTGMKTEFGKIAEKLQEIEVQKTPMQKRLDTFSKQIGLIILAAVAIIMIIGVLMKFDSVNMFLTAVALAVSAIPEGLPAVLTISFAISSIAMSKKNVIVRRLPAVESLGSVTVICSDKTGTITEEKMEVQKIFSNNIVYNKKENAVYYGKKKISLNNEKELELLLKTSILCNNARFETTKGDNYELLGDPTEQALLSATLDLGMNKKTLIEKEHSVRKFEFDSKRKMMSIARDNGRHNVLYSKGAPEKILSICTSELIKGQIKKLTDKRKKEILNELEKMEKDALRVLGFAYKNLSKKEKLQEKEMIFLGLAGMIDPPRKEIKQAIRDCQSAGIEIKIITGDSKLTAQAISEQIGIKGKTITGDELEKINNSRLEQQINEIVIFARTTPQQKLRITEALQKKQHTVAITGDGINDVLALKSADIGVAMGKRGTDVARDVSDIVLLDDNFASIVSGVRQGRKTYDNIKKFTKYFLAVNFTEIVLVLVALMFLLPLPLLPLQILWMNLVTDSLPALALVFEKEENVMKTKPRKEKSILSGIWKFVIVAGLVTFVTEFIVYIQGLSNDVPIAKIRTLVLTMMILFELFFVYTCRSKQPLTKIGIFSNKWLNYAVLISLGLQLLLVYTALGSFFSIVPLTLADWLYILPFSLSGLIIFEVAKYFRKQ